MFPQAGCDDHHLSQQPVKGSKLSNLIGVLPGSTNRVVIVGAHFDHVPAGDGVVDNWAGAALLPSICEALKTTQEDIPTSSSGSQTRNGAKWDHIITQER